jgi:hypothetical protein
MKSFLYLQYHLLLLGIAAVVAIVSATLLIGMSGKFHDSFANSPISGKSPAYNPVPARNSAVAMDSLKKGALLESRSDGASPFVSRPYLLKDGQLIDPMVGDEPLHPPVPNRWLIDHNLDYTDMNILERDPKHKGFTILEEFQAGTDPNDSNQFPPLCAKLNYDESGIKKSSYLLEFTDVEDVNGKKSFVIKPVQPIPNPEKGNRPDASPRSVEIGKTIPGADFLKVVDYRELPKKVINDTEYDANELVLENTVTKAKITLIPKNTSREYKAQLKPIEQIESVTFHYQLSGAPEETVTVNRGNEFTLSSLDKSHTESFRFVDISKDGALLQQKDGKGFTVTSSAPKPGMTSSPLQ